MRRLTLAEALCVASLLAACARHSASPATPPETHTTKEAVMTPAPAWTIWDRHLEVMTVTGRPGHVISAAAPPPGPAELSTHPFLSATSSSPLHEDPIARILAASASLEAFLAGLRAAGFEVREAPPEP